MQIKLQIIYVWKFFTTTRCEKCDKFSGQNQPRICSDCDDFEGSYKPHIFGSNIMKLIQATISLLASNLFRGGYTSRPSVDWKMPCYQDHCLNVREFWKYPIRENKLRTYLGNHCTKYHEFEVQSFTIKGKIWRKFAYENYNVYKRLYD